MQNTNRYCLRVFLGRKKNEVIPACLIIEPLNLPFDIYVKINFKLAMINETAKSFLSVALLNLWLPK